MSLTCGLDNRDSVALRFIFEYGRQHNFVLSRRTQTDQDVSVITSTQDYLQMRNTHTKSLSPLTSKNIIFPNKSTSQECWLSFSKMLNDVLLLFYDLFSVNFGQNRHIIYGSCQVIFTMSHFHPQF